jgi:hypothetical protein
MSTTPTSTPHEWVFDEQAFLRKLPYPVTPTNVKGAYSINPWPDDFDPNTASPQELIRNGILWRRPTADDPPALREAWRKVFSRKWLAKDRAVPVFERQLERTHILRKAPRAISNTNYLGGAWSGAGTFTGGPYNGIIGYWTVPTVSIAPQPGSAPYSSAYSQGILYDSSSWVGIDGFSEVIPSNDALQAGVWQYVDTSGTAHYVAWYEWWTPYGPPPAYVNQQPIPTVPVSPGDEIAVYVSYVGTTAGAIYLGNLTTGKHFAITLKPPTKATFNGQTVEWIMEDPDGGEEAGTALAKFTQVQFTLAMACRPDGTAHNPQHDDTLNIETSSPTPQVLTKVTLGDSTVTIDFIG